MIVPTGDDIAELRAHPFGRVLTEPQLERLFRCASVLDVPAGGFVFREGAPADGFFLIRGGQIALEQQIPGQGTVQMETLRGGDVLGFSWMFEHERWTLDARAIEPTELFALDGACVREEMQADSGPRPGHRHAAQSSALPAPGTRAHAAPRPLSDRIMTRRRDRGRGADPVPVRVRAVENEIADVVTLRLEGAAPRGAFAPGQFNMLYAFGVGEAAISVSGDPAAPDTMHTVRALGAVTRALCALAPGQVVGVRGPFGQPWPVDVAAGGDLLPIAGGLGLAPLRPVVYHALRHRDRYRRVVVLVGARSPADLLFGDELSAWKGDPASGLEVQVIVDRAGADWKGRVGVVTELIAEAVRDPGSTFAFICGPEAMMRFSVRPLARAGIPDERIFVSMERNMKCAAGFCGHCQLGPLFLCKDGPVFPFERVRPWFYMREI